MQQRKDKVVKTMNSGVRSLMKTNKVTTFEGLGTITAPGKVSVKLSDGKTQEIETKNVIIATGSVAVELPFAKFDGKTIVSSTEALTFTEPPKKFLVIGAGAVGLELGSVWNRLGSEVTILEFLPRIAIGFDLELSNLLQRSLTATEEGIACVERIAGKDGHINYDAIAGIIYTNPELAGVGLTEDQAKEKKIDYHVGKFPFRASGRAVANDDLEGIVKFIADAKTDRILGAHILQHAASELIAEAVSVIEFGGSSEDLARTCHSHPTLSEAVKEAAMNVEKRALDIINR